MSRAEQYQDFMRWQCRLRMRAMRERDGRPSEGMSAGIYSINGGEQQASISFLIVRRDSSDRSREFRHIVRKTTDLKIVVPPKELERLESAGDDGKCTPGCGEALPMPKPCLPKPPGWGAQLEDD